MCLEYSFEPNNKKTLKAYSQLVQTARNAHYNKFDVLCCRSCN